VLFYRLAEQKNANSDVDKHERELLIYHSSFTICTLIVFSSFDKTNYKMITRFINAGGFAFILICFILPFVSIKCNETTLASIKGYDMVFGKKDYLKTQQSIFGQSNHNTNT
jgi:hypothetical protein